MKVFSVNEALQRAIEDGGKVSIPAVVGLVATAKEFEQSRFDAGKMQQWALFTDGGDVKLNVENKNTKIDLTKHQGKVLVFAKPQEEPKFPPVRVERVDSNGRPFDKLILNGFSEVYEVTPEGILPLVCDSDNSASLVLPDKVPQSRVVRQPVAAGRPFGGASAAVAPAPISRPVNAVAPPVDKAVMEQENFTRITALFQQSYDFAKQLFTDEVAVQQAASTIAASAFIESNKRY